MKLTIAAALLTACLASCSATHETQPAATLKGTGVELVLTEDNCVSTEPNVRVTVTDFVPLGSSFYVDNFKLYQGVRVRADLREDGNGGLIAALGPPSGLAWIDISIRLLPEGDRILVTPRMTFPNDDLGGNDELSPIEHLRGSIQLAAGTWKVGGPVLFNVDIVGGDDTVLFLARGEARGGVPDWETRAGTK